MCGGEVQVDVHLAEGWQLTQLNVLRQGENLHPLAQPGAGQHPAQLLHITLIWGKNRWIHWSVLAKMGKMTVFLFEKGENGGTGQYTVGKDDHF